MTGDPKAAASGITQGMDFDAWREAWYRYARAQGHELVTDDDFGGVDQFVTSGGYCNGPGCKNCGWTACMHCDWQAKKIPTCSAPGSPVATPDEQTKVVVPK